MFVILEPGSIKIAKINKICDCVNYRCMSYDCTGFFITKNHRIKYDGQHETQQ